MKKKFSRRLKPQSGFTLIELLVVVLIIGILASIAVPQYFKVVEKGKAAEGTALLGTLAGAQETYLAQHGNYCTGSVPTACTPPFDVNLPSALKYFKVGSILVGDSTTNGPDWKIVLTRGTGSTDTPATYGAYTLKYDRQANPTLSCAYGGNNCSDLLP